MPETKNPFVLPGLETKLRDGCLLHAFRSGGGLRVVRLEEVVGERRDKDGNLRRGDEAIAYGEHPDIREALAHAEEDFQAGHRIHDQVYGPIHPHYLTGSTISSCGLDRWVLSGHGLDAYCQTVQGKVQFVVEASYTYFIRTPQKVMDLVLEKNQPVIWMRNDYRYESALSNHPVGSVTTSVLYASENDPGGSAWFQKQYAFYAGDTLAEALSKANDSLATLKTEGHGHYWLYIDDE